jgi:hypothetical protein
VTVPVTAACHSAGDGAADRTARSGSQEDSALGRKTRGVGPQTWPGCERSASGAQCTRSAVSVPRDVEGAAWRSFATHGEAGPRARAKLRCGLRPWAIPASSLFNPERPSPRDRRSVERSRSRLGDEVDRFTARESGEPRVQPPRRCARRPLSRPRPAYAARGAPHARLCLAECQTPPGEAGTRTAREARSGSGVIRSLVPWMEPEDRLRRSTRRRDTTYLAASRRLATSRPDRHERNSRLPLTRTARVSSRTSSAPPGSARDRCASARRPRRRERAGTSRSSGARRRAR